MNQPYTCPADRLMDVRFVDPALTKWKVDNPPLVCGTDVMLNPPLVFTIACSPRADESVMTIRS